MRTDSNKNIRINLNSLNKNIETTGVSKLAEGFVATQIGRDQLGKLTDEWWTDFFLGAALWGVAAGTIRKQ